MLKVNIKHWSAAKTSSCSFVCAIFPDDSLSQSCFSHNDTLLLTWLVIWWYNMVLS